MTIPKADHPIWSLARLAILMLTLCGVLLIEATNFDATELRTLIWVFLGAASVEGGLQAIHRMKQ